LVVIPGSTAGTVKVFGQYNAYKSNYGYYDVWMNIATARSSREPFRREKRAGRKPRPLPMLERCVSSISSTTMSSPAAHAAPRVVARARGAREGRPVRRRGLLGQAGPGVRRPGARIPDPRARPGGARRQRTGRIFTGDRSGDFLFASCIGAGSRIRPRRSPGTTAWLFPTPTSRR
jgi:hypothetical protein